MKKVIKQVEKFHNTFGHPVAPGPSVATKKLGALRHNLMEEENDEYLEAVENENLVEIADALGDQLYVLTGTMLVHGLQDKIMEVFHEIQMSNMSKLGVDGKPIYREDGKILKGENYFRPDIKGVLNGTRKKRV